MPSTYTNNLQIEKPATGEQAGTWGDTANHSYDYLDTGIDGNLSIALSGTLYTLSTIFRQDSEGRNKVITFTGTLSANATVKIDPNTAKKLYFVRNKTAGGFSLIFNQGTGATFTLASNYSAVIYADGTGGAANVYGVLSDLQVDTLRIATALTLAGSATVTGAVTFSGAITANGLLTATAGATISAPITLNVGSDAAYDLHYRSAAGPLARIAIGGAGQVLTAVAGGYQWQTPVIPAVPVTQVFGRTGAVWQAAGDYSADMVSYAVDARTAYANPGFIASLAWNKITGAPAPGISGVSVYYQSNNLFVATNSKLRFGAGSGLAVNIFYNASPDTIDLIYNQVSDARLKRNLTELSGGLPVINRLRPFEYEFNGLAGTNEGEHGASVLAQDLQSILPGSVFTYRARLHSEDEEMTDLLSYNPQEITSHLILAVQQLDRAVQELNKRLV